MKSNIFLGWLFFFVAVCPAFAQFSTTPTIPEANQPVTIYFNKAGTPALASATTLYAHTGVTVNGNTWQNVKGTWANNTTQPQLTLVSGTTYSLTITPDLYTYYGVSTSSSITQICIVVRNAAGNAQSADTFINVGAFQATLTSPAADSTTILNSGESFTVSASNTNGNANYNLLANGSSIAASTGSSFNYTDSNITANRSYELQVTQGTTVYTRRFAVVINPNTVSQALPAGKEDGINYDPNDATKATLVLTAPGKDFVYVAGSFNNWAPGNNYAMRKDPTSGKFWLELTGLTAGQNEYYQYWVVDMTPFTNSPALVKTADPYSTLVVNAYDDPYIPAASYPNMPVFPVGQSRDVTVLKTGQVAYNWQVTNFTKPKKEDLVVYELLVRDFDATRSFQSIIDRIDYFKNLKINAIELMPVMEFEGNESWGYNTSFHMALDKFYGSADKLKELIDLCHQNGIAVILDVALNHAFGRNPMVRMWMKDPDGDGWGDASAENPYFNEFAKHSYSVGNDFNHSSDYTKYYVKRVIKQWIQEFHIDGFRWDLTKGFTQNCSAGDDTCTNAYQADRVAILKDYTDYSWSLDPTHYTIFEHLGIDSEEQQWANYRINETPSKGVMMWGEYTAPYSQLAEGYSTNADISRMNYTAHGFTEKRLLGYPESHDKERMMYSAKTYGNASGANPPLNNLTNSLKRMSSIGAISILIPGPKMIWHFAELGYDDSIFTCNNATVNTDFDTVTGDCKLDTKPQNQWTGNWLTDAQRSVVYSNYAKFISLKINEPVFEGTCTISPDSNNIKQRIYITNLNVPTTQLRNVVILANFSVADLAVNPSFPFTGTWYNLMDNTSMNVTNTTATITIPSGGFRIYGDKMSTLGNEDFQQDTTAAVLYPNPASAYFNISTSTTAVSIYSITGQLVKEFKGTHADDYRFDISDLNRGIYVVKALDGNREQTMKLVRQ